jgi:outer membrane protein assembly factor BamB
VSILHDDEQSGQKTLFIRMEAMMRKLLICICILPILLLTAQVYGQDNWVQFRGANGGVAAGNKALPVTFDENTNFIWKTVIGHGHSSPCIWGDRIFLTAMDNNELETICINRTTGKILWRKTAWYEFIERVHKVNSPASPTPTTDGERVYVYFGSSGLLCYDFDGKEVWTRVMRTPPNMYGTASSLILAGGKLIFLDDNQQESSLEAIHPANGEMVWKVKREGFKASWSTPMLWNNNGVDELVIYGVWWLKAYDLRDGSERWSLPGLTDEPCVTPVTGGGLVYLTSYNMKNNPEVIGLPEWKDLIKDYDKDGDGELTHEETLPNKSILSRFDADGEGDHPLWGFHRWLDADKNGKINEKEWGRMHQFLDSFQQENALLAVKPGAESGEETKVVWRHEKGVPECPSLLYYRDRIYMVKNGGIISCLDAETGELKYQESLGSGGPYYASLVVSDGKIYASSRRGVVTVFEAGDALNVLARNDLKERIMATPAVVDGKLYVRTDKSIMAFGLKK